MKPVLEWLDKWTGRKQISQTELDKHLLILRQIQLDAWRSGMKDANLLIEGLNIADKEFAIEAIDKAILKKTIGNIP